MGMGGGVALVAVAGLSLAPRSGPPAAERGPAPSVVDAETGAAGGEAAPLDPGDRPACPGNPAAVRFKVRTDPGLADPETPGAVPIYRTYVPARLSVLACPARPTCTVPDTLPLRVWTEVPGRGWAPLELDPEVTRHGDCAGFAWRERARVWWPDAPEGVVAWAVTLGPAHAAGDPAAWREGGAEVWEADVIFAGEDGTPRVE